MDTVTDQPAPRPTGAHTVRRREIWSTSPLRPWNAAARERLFAALKRTGSAAAAGAEWGGGSDLVRRLCAADPEAADRIAGILGHVPGKPAGVFLGWRERRRFLDGVAAGLAFDAAAAALTPDPVPSLPVVTAAETIAKTMTAETPASPAQPEPTPVAEPTKPATLLGRLAALRNAEPEFARQWDAAVAAAGSLRRSRLAAVTDAVAVKLIEAGKPVPEQYLGGEGEAPALAPARVSRAEIRRVQERIRSAAAEAAAAGRLRPRLEGAKHKVEPATDDAAPVTDKGDALDPAGAARAAEARPPSGPAESECGSAVADAPDDVPGPVRPGHGDGQRRDGSPAAGGAGGSG